MRNIIPNNFYIAVLLNGVLFAVVLLLFTPCFHTDTDIYFLYTLSGGFGEPPSALLHYSDGAHPVISGIVAFFFRYFPGFNWYSFFLLLFNFVCCVTILHSFLHYFRKLYAIGAFIIFFLFIEARSLLWLDFSAAALIGSISGSVSLLLYLKNKKDQVRLYRKRLFFFAFLIFISGLIRIHYMALFGGFAIGMAIFFLPRRQLARFIKIQLLLGLLVVIFFQWQRYYFQKKITGWREEERTRKAYIYYVNHPHDESLSTFTGIRKLKHDLISVNLLYDKTLTGYDAIKDFSKNNTKPFKIIPGSFPSFYWLFMDIRIYLFLFAIMIMFFVMTRNFLSLFRFIGMSLFSALGFLILALYFKTTEVILISVLASIILSGLLCIDLKQAQKTTMLTSFFLILLACAWMGIRLVKISNQNKLKITYARNVIEELNDQKNILFVDAGTFFDFNLSIWDEPKKYPIHNFIYSDLVFSNSYKSQLNRYGITNLMKEIPVKNNIYLVGERASVLIEYYRLLCNQTVLVKKIPGLRFIDAYGIKHETNQ